jgi:superkiller protein 3
LGNALWGKGDLAGAIAAYRDAVLAQPDYVAAYERLGQVLEQVGDLDGAIAEVREAIRLSNHVVDHFVLGKLLQRKGLLDEAIASYNKAMELDPKCAARAYRGLGCALTRQDKYDDAVVALRAALRLEPNNAVAHHNLGLCLQAKGDLDGAEGAYREAVRLDGKHHGAAIDHLAELLLSGGNLKEAIATYQKIIILDPKDASAHNRLAWLLATCPDPKLRDPKRVLELAKKALQLAPQDGESWKSLGAAHYGLRDWKATIAAFEKANTFFSGGGSNEWFFLAMARWQLGEKDLARQAYDRAVQWMEKYHPKNRDLARLRSEVAELLGMEKKKD